MSTKINKSTDVNSIRSTSKALLFAVDINCDNPFGIISHPFANHIFAVGENHEIFNLMNEYDCKKWRNSVSKKID